MADRDPDPALVAKLRRAMGAAAHGFDLDAHARNIAREVERATKRFGDATRDLLRDLDPRKDRNG